MKYTFLSLGLILLAPTVFSQTFISENKLWSQVEFATEYGHPYESHFIKMKGDTIVDDEEYTKVYRSNDSLQLKWFFEGFIRETDTGSVFLRMGNLDFESLLVDFGVEEHDSIRIESGGYQYAYVDSIRMKSFGIFKEYRKHIFLSVFPGGQGDIWIEGVGSHYGVLNDLSFIGSLGQGRTLLCFTENDTSKYIDSYFNTCFKTGVYTSSIKAKNIEVINTVSFPNPASQNITIQFDNARFKTYQIVIYDNLGRLISILDEVSNSKVEVDVSKYESGIYYFKLLNDTGWIGSCGKFLVE